MLEEEYQLDYFRDHNLVRKVCTSCGAAFWTRDPDRKVCGDAPCEPYSFIGSPVFAPHDLDSMREAFLSFHERHQHTRLERYPVVARWRDDIYLTIASIADFQPFVTSGLVPPPANPLTISQPCIRLNDLDAVGRSGRHMTLFEMMAHHAFNSPGQEIYWKDTTLALCDEFLASIGADLQRVSYKEHPWFGGGNAGPSVEVLIGGLEVATLVFMNMGRQKTADPPVILDGEPYYPMPIRIVDTGYGLERLVWASLGSPTIYDAAFPEAVDRITADAGLSHAVTDPEYRRILGLNAKYAGLVDIRGSNLGALREQVAGAIGIPVARLLELIVPMERVYTIADHTRCLAYMLGDCIVPSNVREGYLARLVLRRTLRMMHELCLPPEAIADYVDLHLRLAGPNTFTQDAATIRDIVTREVERYALTMERGTRIVQRLAQSYREKGEAIPVQEAITLYDSHGIPAETLRELAAAEGAETEIPDDFYSRIAQIHSGAEGEAEEPLERYRERVKELPLTKRLYYDSPHDMEFESTVLDTFDGLAVLDQTLFYPEGGGQPSDTGTLMTSEGIVRVDRAVKLGEVILHQTKGGVMKVGEKVKGKLDEERRLSLMRHHTGTHILLHACKVVLGTHIHQAGAQKGSDSSRLDIRHFRHITPEELARIEIEANRMVMMALPVYIRWEERTHAEQKYGFDLYQGGVPPGKEIRVVQVDGEVQACGGTHCGNTGEVGTIKVLRVEHIQDGIERLEFAAGSAALYAMQHLEQLLGNSADALSVQRENLPGAAARFFQEWKDQKKEIERLQAKVAELSAASAAPETIAGTPVLVRRLDLPPKEMAALAQKIADQGGVALLAGGSGKVHVAAASGNPKVNAADLVAQVCTRLGGKGGGTPQRAQGGGTDTSQIDAALAVGRRRVEEALHG